MRGLKWTRKTKALAGLAVAVMLFLGVTGMVRFPAIATVTAERVCLPDTGKTQDEYARVTDCWGIPFVYRSCVTDWELKAAESGT